MPKDGIGGNMERNKETEKDLASPERRRFIVKSGKLAAATPPALTFLLSTSLASDAVAKSAGGKAAQTGKDRRDRRVARRERIKDALRKLFG